MKATGIVLSGDFLKKEYIWTIHSKSEVNFNLLCIATA